MGALTVFAMGRLMQKTLQRANELFCVKVLFFMAAERANQESSMAIVNLL